jgi:PKD repeat protein
MNYRWIFGDGTSENTTEAKTSHIYNSPGVYNIELIVIDMNGNFNSTYISLVVYRDTDEDLVADYVDLDDDGDGIPDEWEILNELDPLDPSDASKDIDGDGINNFEEYQREKNPNSYDFSDNSIPIIVILLVVFSMVSVGIFYTRIQKNP